MKTLPNYTKSLENLKKLKSAVIDSSSIIYMEKAGFLDAVIAHLPLHSHNLVQDEIAMPINIEWHYSDIKITDEAIIKLALELSMPLISDDKKMINRLIVEKQEAYNALMILHWLYLKAHISLSEHLEYLTRLIRVARYSPAVIEYGNQVFALML
ncbi:MAG: hypothetical protein JXR70_05640 [Spirochaetales bacterium]|nr:hypothetical protein [Spirochaetales bacterium]